MDKIKIQSFENSFLKMALIMAPILQLFCGVLVYIVLNDESGMLILLFMIFISLIQIPVLIFVTKRFSLIRDYFIVGDEIIQNNIAICNKSDVVHVGKFNIFKSVIKYVKNGNEYTIGIQVSNKQLNELKEIFHIYE
jgi:hypothetical protein